MNPATLWRPLRVPIFRNLLAADVISDIGTFMQSVGAAWLMVSLNAGPMYVALIQTASSLPFFLLALPAGSAGDIVDRHKLILFTEAWMVCVANRARHPDHYWFDVALAPACANVRALGWRCCKINGTSLCTR
jgi:MFS family permease